MTSSSKSEDDLRQTERLKVESLYLEKFRDYILTGNKISRLQARHNNLRMSLAAENETLPRQVVSTRRRIGRWDSWKLTESLCISVHRSAVSGGSLPKLFGGSLEEYIEAVKQDIPLVVRSCIRVINLHGLHHQGIFRVSGSKVAANERCWESLKVFIRWRSVASERLLSEEMTPWRIFRTPVRSTQWLACWSCTWGSSGNLSLLSSTSISSWH